MRLRFWSTRDERMDMLRVLLCETRKDYRLLRKQFRRVVDANKNLAQINRGYQEMHKQSEADLDAVRRERDAAREQLQEIYHLHTDSVIGFCPSCFRANDVSDTDDGLVGWPCPTLRAMGVQDVELRPNPLAGLPRFFDPADALLSVQDGRPQ